MQSEANMRSAGYVLLKSRSKKLEDVTGIDSLRLKSFSKFNSAVAALEQAAALTDGKVTPMLSSLLEDLKGEKATLAVQDPKLGNSIAQIPGFNIKTITDSSTQDVFRTIREHLTQLLPDLLPAEESATRLGYVSDVPARRDSS